MQIFLADVAVGHGVQRRRMRVEQVIQGRDPRFHHETFVPEILYHGNPRIGARNYRGRLIGHQRNKHRGRVDQMGCGFGNSQRRVGPVKVHKHAGSVLETAVADLGEDLVYFAGFRDVDPLGVLHPDVRGIPPICSAGHNGTCAIVGGVVTNVKPGRVAATALLRQPGDRKWHTFIYVARPPAGGRITGSDRGRHEPNSFCPSGARDRLFRLVLGS
jgi:hypothetical protein